MTKTVITSDPALRPRVADRRKGMLKLPSNGAKASVRFNRERASVRSDGTSLLIRDKKIPAYQERNLQITNVVEKEAGAIEFSLSSEEPYERWFGTEILRHDESAVNIERINNGNAAFLFNHNRDDYIGVLKKGWLDNGKLRVQAVFELDNEDNPLARKIHKSVCNGTLKSVSVGYSYDEITFEERDGQDYVIATKWTPYEGSIVTVPADPTVGIGRSQEEKRENSKEEVANGSTPSATDPILTKIENTTMQVETPTKAGGNAFGQKAYSTPEELLSQERERSQSLLAVGKKYNCPELAEKAITGGWSVQEMRSHILDHQPEQKPVAGIAPVGMNDKERKQYSFLRAIGYAMGKVSADKVGLELEVSRELEKRTGRTPSKGGILLDQSELVSYRAPLETGVPAAAGNLIATNLLSDRFIEQLYNMSAFLQMGVTYLRDLTPNIEIPREDTFTGGYWVGEKQSIPVDTGAYDKISMSPKKLAVITEVTFEMVQQSSIDLEILMRNRLLRGLALELDRAIGFGTGTGFQPLGIASHPETKSIVLGANGAPLDWAAVIAMQTELFANNVSGNMGYVINQRTRGKLATTLDHATGSGNWIWQNTRDVNTGTIAGYPARVSNQIPNNLVKGTATDLTAIFFGCFDQVLVGMWSGLEVDVNPYSQFREAITEIRAMQLVDVNLSRGDYFAIATDVINV